MAKEQKKPSVRKGERPSSNGDPILASYLSEIAHSTPLSTTEEATLAEQIRAGNEEARNQLVEANLRFVVTVAKDYQKRGLALAELISAGNVGLITAAERFDETRGFKFISYAVWWIRQSILQALMEQSTVRIPINRQDMLAKIVRTYEGLHQDGQPPSLEKVADTLGLSKEEVEQTLVSGQPICSLDAPFEQGEERCLMDCLGDQSLPSPEEAMLDYTLRRDLRRVLGGLKGREAEVLSLYFGLGQERPMTLDQIGLRFKLTRERVRQIKEVALNKLRHPRLCARLRAYEEN